VNVFYSEIQKINLFNAASRKSTAAASVCTVGKNVQRYAGAIATLNKTISNISLLTTSI
jgi:hypothetical protein